MPRSIRTLAVLIAGLLAVPATVASAQTATGGRTQATVSTAAQATSASTELRACQHLRSDTAYDRLTNGNFELTVSSDFLYLQQRTLMNGTYGPDHHTMGTWFRNDPTGRHQANNHTTLLAFYCNGDLALRDTSGYLHWRTNTAGRGGVRLVLTAGGNLVMYNTAGGVVWQSGSGRIAIGANSILPSNSRLVSVWGNQQGDPVATLGMQTDGNLVYREGSRVRWQSNTHVPGSRAALTTAAELRVLSPGGTVLWSSRNRGTSYSVLEVEHLSITQFSPGIKAIWSPPLR